VGVLGFNSTPGSGILNINADTIAISSSGFVDASGGGSGGIYNAHSMIVSFYKRTGGGGGGAGAYEAYPGKGGDAFGGGGGENLVLSLNFASVMVVQKVVVRVAFKPVIQGTAHPFLIWFEVDSPTDRFSVIFNND